MLTFAAICFLPPFLISVVATAILRKKAPQWGLMDQPDPRKMHRAPTPLGGGIAIWLAVMGTMLAATILDACSQSNPALAAMLPRVIADHLGGVSFRLSQLWAVLAGGTILAVVGLIDDARGLPWAPRLAVQFLVAYGLYACGVQATVFVPLPWLGGIVTVLWIIVLVNSFNFLDNMDGLSAGIGLIAATMFAAIMLTSLSEPRWLVGGLLLVLAGALTGFLCHNWPPAKIFMGDSGSYFIGLLLASATVLGTFYDSAQAGTHVILAPLCILAIPLYDFGSVLLIRLLQRRSPFRPDKNHFSHRLVDIGLKPRNAVLTVHLATLTTGLGALLLYKVPDWTSAMLVIALILCILSIVAILETAGRRSDGRNADRSDVADKRP